MIQWIEQACAAGARRERACQVLGLTVRTVQRWCSGGEIKAHGRATAVHCPANQLSEPERQQILTVVNRPQFQNLPPSQIVPTLADQGVYLASESSFYRVLRQAGPLKPRGKAQAPTPKAPPRHRATGPNQVWSWAITYLATTVRGVFFYL